MPYSCVVYACSSESKAKIISRKERSSEEIVLLYLLQDDLSRWIIKADLHSYFIIIMKIKEYYLFYEHIEYVLNDNISWMALKFKLEQYNSHEITFVLTSIIDLW